MSAFSESVLIERLTKLNPSQQSIQSMSWVVRLSLSAIVVLTTKLMVLQLYRTGSCTIASNTSKWLLFG
jgi:hypothetical protein